MRSRKWSGVDGAVLGSSIVVTSVSSTYDSAVRSILYFLHMLVNVIPVHNAGNHNAVKQQQSSLYLKREWHVAIQTLHHVVEEKRSPLV